MKTKILYFLISLPLFANVTLLKETDAYVDLRVTTQLPSIKIEQADCQVDFPDWSIGGTAGEYALPVERTVISLPPLTEASMRILSIKRSSRIVLPKPLKTLQAHGEEMRVKSQKTISSNFEIQDQGQAEGDGLVLLVTSPMRYFPVRQQFDYIEEAIVRIQFVKGNVISEPVMQAAKTGQVAKWLAINAPAKLAPYNRKSLDLVIAHKSYETTLKVYLEKKRAMGREVKEYYVENATTSSIKKIIDEEYKSKTPPSTTMLVGSIAQIPSYTNNQSNWTDYNYTLLGRDSIPDIALGRIPAQTDDELKNMIAKLLSREQEVLKYKDILLTAGKDTSMGCPANVTNVGQKLKAGYSDAELIKKYRTVVSTQAVIDAYNAEPNVLFYDGHGDKTSMIEIPLSISSMNQLTNRKNYLMFDIACLNANWSSSGPKARNFAESILLRPDSGAAGILASGGSGWGHEFFQTIGELMGKARAGETPDPELNQVGRVILLAKIKHGTQDRTFWNYYGDPSTSVWESTWGK